MYLLPEIIVYIWLLPLLIFIVLPLSMLIVYLVGRFIHFMLFPKRILDKEAVLDIPEAELKKAA